MADNLPPVAEIPRPPPSRTPWGFWATMGWSAVVGLIFLAIQMLVTATFMAVHLTRDPSLDPARYAETLKTNGLLFAVATCVTAPCCVGLVALLAKLRRGMPLRSYLGLEPVPAGTLGRWLGALILFAAASDSLSLLLGRPIVPEFATNLYRDAGWLPLLWFTVVAVAPVWEETFFRGFMFKGIQRSRAGPVGAVLLTALPWSLVHLQYDAYGITTIFATGLLLGVARHRTGSLYVTILMHSAMNLVATIETMLIVR